MTFAEYNTDEYFNNKDSTADGLIKAAYDEGKTREEVENSLSPLWKADKKGNVKKALDNYYKVEQKEEPKKEEKKEEVKETVTTDVPASTLTGRDKAYNDKQNKLADAAKKEMLDDIKTDSKGNWEDLYNSSLKRADAYKIIDDHYLEGLSNFMLKRYSNGEFGNVGDDATPEEKSNAKTRLAYFLVNGIQSKLRQASNAAALAAGRSPMFSQEQTTSDYEKFNNSQMGNALQNRWEKNKADTDGAIKAVEKEFGNEQDARIAAEQFTRDRKANTKWNMMDQKQKIYALQVTKEIGDMLGGMDTSELANFIAGSALTGDVNKEEVIAIGIAKLAAKSPEILSNLPEGNIKTMVMGMIGGEPQTIVAGLGGTGEDGGETGTTLEDGTKVDPGKYMNSKEYKELVAAGDKLSDQYYNGEIDEEKFRSEYAKLEKIMSEHGWFSFFQNKGIKSADDLIRVNNRNNLIRLSDSLDELNANAKNMSKKDYLEQYENLKSNAQKWGITEKQLNAMEKDKEKSLSDIEKANKKKKKK